VIIFGKLNWEQNIIVGYLSPWEAGAIFLGLKEVGTFAITHHPDCWGLRMGGSMSPSSYIYPHGVASTDKFAVCPYLKARNT
jgi:hypothetical protein